MTTKTWRDLHADHLHNTLSPGHPAGENDTGVAVCDRCGAVEERHGPYDEMERFIDRFYVEHQHEDVK